MPYYMKEARKLGRKNDKNEVPLNKWQAFLSNFYKNNIKHSKVPIIHVDEELDNEISEVEIRFVIKNVRNNKASEEDEVNYEFLRHYQETISPL